jgi:hypothetical protein
MKTVTCRSPFIFFGVFTASCRSRKKTGCSLSRAEKLSQQLSVKIFWQSFFKWMSVPQNYVKEPGIRILIVNGQQYCDGDLSCQSCIKAHVPFYLFEPLLLRDKRWNLMSKTFPPKWWHSLREIDTQLHILIFMQGVPWWGWRTSLLGYGRMVYLMLINSKTFLVILECSISMGCIPFPNIIQYTYLSYLVEIFENRIFCRNHKFVFPSFQSMLPSFDPLFWPHRSHGSHQ